MAERNSEEDGVISMNALERFKYDQAYKAGYNPGKCPKKDRELIEAVKRGAQDNASKT